MSHQPSLGPGRFRVPESQRKPSVVMALSSAALLLLVIVGVPALLLGFLGWPPLPESWSLSILTQALSADALLGVLEWVVWLAWLQFTVCAITELASALKHDGVPLHVPMSGTVQGVVRKLVVTALLLTSVSVPAAAAPLAQAPVNSPVPAVSAPVQGAGDYGQVDGGTSAPDPERAQVPSQGVSATSASVRYMLGDRVLDPELGAKLVGQRVYIVQAPQGHYHDNLWDIAERSLGDGRAYRQIYDLNVGREQPDGLSLELARLIQPDWHLIMPESAVDVPRVVAVPDPVPAPVLPSPSQDGTQAPQQEQGDIAPAQQLDDVMPATMPAVGALTAASLVALLLRRRRLGVWGWPGAEAGELERLLRIGADFSRSRRLEEALLHLSRMTEPPAFYAAGVSDTAVTLFMSMPRTSAPAPWRAEHNGNVWILPAQAELVTAPGPITVGVGLVTLGRDDLGTDVLLDLSQVDGEVVVSGAPAQAVEVISALALELCVNPWSGSVQATGVLLPWALFQICGGRLQLAESLETVLRRSELGPLAGRHLVQQHHVVLSAQPQAGSAGRLADGQTVVRTGSLEGARWRIQVDSSGMAQVEPLGVSVRVSRATEADLFSLAGLLSDTAPANSSGPSTPPPVTTAALRSAPVRVLLLGEPVVQAPGEVEPERVAVLTEAVSCLALHPEGLHPQVLGAMIWPLGVTGDVVQAAVQRLRQWLGKDQGGTERLGEDEMGRLRLSPEVVVDTDVLRHLLEASAQLEEPQEREHLNEALRLVRGPLCLGAESGRYAWLARLRLGRDIAKMVTEAALRLAELSGGDDPEGAAAALSTGLSVVELDQRLWQAVFRLAASQGTERLAGKVSELLDLAGADDLYQIDPQTAALVDDLAPGYGLGTRLRPA